MTLPPKPSRSASPRMLALPSPQSATQDQGVPDPAPPPHKPPAPAPNDPDLSARGPITAGFVTLGLLCLGFGLWSFSTKIAGAVVAPGQIEVDQQRQVVQHPDGGIVTEIFVREGDRVHAGEVLIRLDDSLLSAELAIVDSQYYDLLARRGRLEAERADAETLNFPAELMDAARLQPEFLGLIRGQTDLFTARSETLRRTLDEIDARLLQTRAQIAGTDVRIAAQEKQSATIAKELDIQYTLLAKGLAQMTQVLALERSAAGLAGSAGELQALRAQYAGQISELELQRLQQLSQRREDAETGLRDIAPRELELAQRRSALNAQIARLDLLAPVAGRIYDLSVTTPRAVIRAAEPVLYIVPEDRPLVVQVRIPTVNIDEVHSGQTVALRFPALSGRFAPELEGRVDRVSADALTDEVTHVAYYRADITLSRQEEQKLSGESLLPGMPAEAFIRTSERSPLAYLLKPFTDYLSHAFREK